MVKHLLIIMTLALIILTAATSVISAEVPVHYPIQVVYDGPDNGLYGLNGATVWLETMDQRGLSMTHTTVDAFGQQGMADLIGGGGDYYVDIHFRIDSLTYAYAYGPLEPWPAINQVHMYFVRRTYRLAE